MRLTITLQKEVETSEQGQQLYDTVKQKLADHPEVIIAGSCHEKMLNSEPE